MLLLATEAGELIKFDLTSRKHKLLFKASDKDAFMGMAQEKGYLFLATLDKIFKLDMKSWLPVAETSNYRPSPDFHQMQIYNELLYTTITKKNQIWIYDMMLNHIDTIDIASPFPSKPVVYKDNYNHVNNIVLHKNKFYVNLNWFTSTPYAFSGVAEFDHNFSLLRKFEFGWETHDFQFVEDDMVAVCASSNKRKKIIHPYKAGLMVNNNLVFEHDPDEVYCKTLAFDNDYFYLCGGKKRTRLLRRLADGVIYIIDRRDYSLVETLNFEDIKAIKGCLLVD